MLTPEQKAMLLKSDNFQQLSGMKPKTTKTLQAENGFNKESIMSQFDALESSTPSISTPRPKRSAYAQQLLDDYEEKGMPEVPKKSFLENTVGRFVDMSNKVGDALGQGEEKMVRDVAGMGVSLKNAAQTAGDLKKEADRRGMSVLDLIKENKKFEAPDRTEQTANLPLIGETKPFMTGKEEGTDAAWKIAEGAFSLWGLIEQAKSLTQLKSQSKQVLEGLGITKPGANLKEQLAAEFKDIPNRYGGAVDKTKELVGQGKDVLETGLEKSKALIGRGEAARSKKAVDLLNPDLSKRAIKSEVLPSGRAESGSFFKNPHIIPSDEAATLGPKYNKILNTKSSIDATNNAIKEGRKVESKLAEVLAKDAASVPDDAASQLAIRTSAKKSIRDGLDDMPRGLKNQTQEYQDFLNWADEIIDSQPANAKGIIEARRMIDAGIKKEYPGIIDSVTGRIKDSSPVSAAWRSIRNSLNKHAYNMSEVGEEAKSLILKEADLFNIRRILENSAAKELGGTSTWNKILKKVWGVGKTAGAGYLGWEVLKN